MKPRLFIGSAQENIEIAYAAQQNLQDSAEITVWDQGIFNPSQSNLESLLSALDGFEIGLFIFAPDDLVKIRGIENQTVRDNVLFELGLFVGRLGKKRCFILMPRGEALHIPTDLIGMNPVFYDADRSDKNHRASTGPACHEIRSAIRKTGLAHIEPSTPETAPEKNSPTEKKPSDAIKEELGNTTEAPPKRDWLSAYMNKNYPEAIRLIEADLSTGKNEQEQINLTSWIGLIKFDENMQTGSQYLENIIREHPNVAEYSNLLASAYQGAGFYEEAIRVADRGLETEPNDQALTITKAENLNLLGKQTEAITTLLHGLKEDGNSDTYHLALSKLFSSINKLQVAGAVLELGLEKSPFSEKLLYQYADVLSELGEWAKSILICRKLIRINPKEPGYRTLIANSCLRLEINGVALDAYNEANKLADEKQGWIIANIGNLYNNRGLYSVAIEHLEHALTLAPDNQFAQDRLLRAKQNSDQESSKLEALLQEAAAAPKLLNRFKHSASLEDLVLNELPDQPKVLSNSGPQDDN